MNKFLGVLSILAFSIYSNAAQVIPAGKYQMDPAHTSISFEVSHMGVSFVLGRFDTFTGTFNYVPKGDSSVNVDVDINSIDTNEPQRDQHLRTSDFFDVVKFPKMNFTSQKVDYDADGNPTVIHGTLTLHGTSKPLDLTVSPVGTGVDAAGDHRAGLRAHGLIKRSEYGMTGLMAAAGDNVSININVEGILQ